MSGHRIPYDLFAQQNKSIKDPGSAGTIRVERDLAHVALVSAGAEARTLSAPTQANLRCLLYAKTVGGTITLTVTGGYDESGSTTGTFTATGQCVQFISVEEGSNYRWRVVSYDGFTGPTIAMGSLTLGGTLAVAGATTLTGAVSAASSVKSSSPTAGVGYATGAGGTVTQATSRSTGVTLSKTSGQITTTADSLAAATIVTFTVTNTTVAATDSVIVSKVSGDVDTHCWVNAVAAGSFDVSLRNTHASSADVTAFVLNFAVIKGVTA